MLVLRVGKTTSCRGNDDLTMLRQHGMRCENTESGHDALEFLRLYEYDIVLMDLHLPDMSGHEVVKKMRSAGKGTPVLMLTDAVTPQQTTTALDIGADDVLIVPCDPQELLARIRAIIRRSNGYTSSTLRSGPVELSLDRREIRVHGRLLPTTRHEYALLELLFLKQGLVQSKAALLNHLYCGQEEPEVKTLDVIICRLRKKLTNAGVPTLIGTVWGCGHILHDPQTNPTVITNDSVRIPQMALAA
jgi:two-component system cell cycle response regulator CtrA